MTTTTLPDGHALGVAIKQRFESIEAKLTKIENEMIAGFTQVLENEKQITNGLAKITKQTEPFK